MYQTHKTIASTGQALDISYCSHCYLFWVLHFQNTISKEPSPETDGQENKTQNHLSYGRLKYLQLLAGTEI